MSERIDARDVLDVNAKTVRSFQARVVGVFRQTGPNPWDSFAYEPIADGADEEIFPGVPVQTEPAGAEFRMRWHGEVYRLVWVPKVDEAAAMPEPLDRRCYFLAQLVVGVAADQGIGAAATIARILTETPDGSMND